MKDWVTSWVTKSHFEDVKQSGQTSATNASTRHIQASRAYLGVEILFETHGAPDSKKSQQGRSRTSPARSWRVAIAGLHADRVALYHLGWSELYTCRVLDIVDSTIAHCSHPSGSGRQDMTDWV